MSTPPNSATIASTARSTSDRRTTSASEPLRDDSALGQLADDPVGGGPVPGEDRHPGARLAERRRERLAQSAVAAGDDGDPAVEVERVQHRHRDLPGMS